MASSAIALLLSGGFDDDAEPKLSSSSPSAPALRGIGGGPCSLERWLSLPSLPPRVLLVVAAAGGAGERRVRSFLELKKRLFPALSIEVVVCSREDEGKQLAAAAESAALSLSSSPSSSLLVVADAAAVPLGLDLARLRAAASLLSAPAVVVSASPLGGSKSSSSSSGAEALQKTCRGLGKVSLLGRGSSVARVAAFLGAESKSSDSISDDGEVFDAQRVVFLPASSLESAARHPGSVRSWLRAQGPNLRALVSSASPPSSPGGGPLPHASSAAGRALAATLLSRGGKWSAVLPASGAEAWLAALVASASAAAGDDDGDGDAGFELEEEERRPEKSSEGLSPPLPKPQHASFSTTSSAYGAAAPPAVAAALASSAAAAAAALASRRRLGGGGASSASSSTLPPSSSSAASPRKPSMLLPPLSPVLKTGSSGAAGGTLRFDIPRSRVHDKLDA